MITATSIRPETVASRLAAADHLTDTLLAVQLEKNPRLVEMLCFIQWRSFQPGGLNALADELLKAFAERISSSAERKAGKPGANGRWTDAQCREAWLAEYLRSARLDFADTAPDFMQWARKNIDRAFPTFDDLDAAQMRHGAERFNHQYFSGRYRWMAQDALPRALKDICETEGEICPPLWFPTLLECLVEFMDQNAVAQRNRVAITTVTKQVFDALDYALAERKLLRIHGSARFGKSESLKAYCDARPGLIRMVTVPCSNSETDLVRAVGEALGIAASYGCNGPALRGKVEYILTHGRLGFCFDEAHALFPTRYNGNTAPARLNWLRSQIVDRRRPCVLASTPQSYDGQRRKFEKTTGYNMEQWTGRIGLTVNLPEKLSQQDMMSVARLHFPELRESLVENVVGAAMRSQSYLKAIEDIAARARWLAKRRDANAICLRDIDDAIGDVVPELNAPAPDALEEAEVVTLPPVRKPAAEVLQEVCGNRISNPKPNRIKSPLPGELVPT